MTYLLIHGAWHSSWCWKYVTPLLKNHGCEVIEVDLPGHGRHVAVFEDINLASYVSYVVDLVKAQHDPVVLVGHSMAGVIISQAAEYIPEYIDRLVYVAAFIPENNLSVMQEAHQSASTDLPKVTLIDEENNIIRINQSARVRKLFFNACTETDASFAMASLQNQPFKPFIEPINISTARFNTVKKTYIECLNDQVLLPKDQKRMYSKIACDVVSLQADHSPFFSAPAGLAALILGNGKKKL